VSALLPLPLAVPLLVAALGFLLRDHRGAQRLLTAGSLATVLGVGVALVAATRDGGAVATTFGLWPRELSIVWAADGLSALMTTVTATMAAFSVVVAGARGEDRHPLFHPMVNALLAGVLGSFLTADLFNLFVTFEVMLIASYVLLTLRGGAAQVRAGAVYVGVNLLASTLFLLGIALLYGSAGTVDLGALAGVVVEVPGARVGATLVGTAVAVKASLVPMHAWLPRTYVVAGPAVTALFSGLLTKAGVFVLYRLASTVFAGDEATRRVVLVLALVTMVVGVLGAIGRGDARGILAFHMVSQVGYLVLPIGLWTPAAVAAGLVYLLQYVLVKGALFLAVAAVESFTGTGRLAELGGMVRTRPYLAVGFLLSALALAGIPPTSGFVGKLLLLLAALGAEAWLAAGLLVLVSLFTLLSMVKIWNGVFWGEPTERVRREPVLVPAGVVVPSGGAGDLTPPPPARPSRSRVLALVGPSLTLGVAVVLLGLAGPWLVDLVTPAAEGLLDPAAFLEAVRQP
jgi:multicomponent Na+:H+ antiporter subunit D